MSYAICEQQRRRSACASALSDQHLCCSLLKEYDMCTCYIQSFKILASFCSWAGCFETCLVENPRWHVFAWCGSIKRLPNLLAALSQRTLGSLPISPSPSGCGWAWSSLSSSFDVVCRMYSCLPFLRIRVVSPTFPFAPESFRPLSLSPRIVSPPGRFAHFPVRPWVVSPTSPFAPESFRPLINFISSIIISASKVV